VPARLTAIDLVALILAVGLVVAFVALCAGGVYNTISAEQRGVSENLTQVLSGLSGGLIGILGGLVGYRIGNGTRKDPQP